MWAFLSARLRLWLLLAVGAPALSWLLGVIGDRLEARNGPTSISRALQKGRGWLRRRSSGPLARDHDRH
ncbi:MAG: hypothetical protein M3Z25_15760 [Actinomycetota bacterium]|nr:hypothetical protein [Actinomycetota bacterium]